MAVQLSKRQVEHLLAHVDAPIDRLRAELDRAVGAAHDGCSTVDRLRSLGRHAEAIRLAAGDRETAWALVSELNERRQL